MATVPFYVLLGESNAGWTPMSLMTDQDKQTYNNVIPLTDIWNPGRGAFSAQIEPLTPGVNTMCENYADLTQFGPEVAFMKCLQDQQPRQRFLYKQGQANTSMVVDWKPVFPYTGGEGSRFSQLTQWLPMAVEQALAKGYELDLKAIIWVGGENDSKGTAESRAKQYFEALSSFFSAFDTLWKSIAEKNKLPLNPYKRVIGKVNAPGPAFPYRDFVRNAQIKYASDPANNAVLIDTDSYGLFDYAHYDGKAMVQYGVDIFNAAQCEQPSIAPVAAVSFSGKVFLQGAYNSASGTMNNFLNSEGILETHAKSHPFNTAPFNYSGNESVKENFFLSNPDIVDWVLIELRDSANPSSVVARRAALLKKDGTVVEKNGTDTQIRFEGVSASKYFVAVRHRNHLGIRSSGAIDFSSGAGNYDFTSAATKAFQNQSYTSTVEAGGRWLMRAGNSNSNSNVRYVGPQNDQDHILNDLLGGSIGKVIDNVYSAADLNLDGAVKVSGPANDQNFLLNDVLNGSTGMVYTEQL
ncbi:hypothetical protein EXU57_04230 [Segetibacter sp. 3557_3]|uniref:sialate O-acetylesterase n=1 Tax=Segetibacter sp. 3557_3 TaxID=2547429 RepID=UPI0010586F0D|nr:sialate O-acetylesterase [Segetibacter sp. 3557_3]TDH29277.1 hypothetical protein EXU57_04230 [Segetibacter sp. 3557_3]